MYPYSVATRYSSTVVTCGATEPVTRISQVEMAHRVGSNREIAHKLLLTWWGILLDRTPNMGTNHLELEWGRFRGGKGGKDKYSTKKSTWEHFLRLIVIAMYHEKRARGHNISKHCGRQAVVPADPTCRSQSRGPKGSVVYG